MLKVLSQQNKTPSLCSRIVSVLQFGSLNKQGILGVLILTPSPTQFLGLPAPALTTTTAPPEIPTASLCRPDARLLNKPCVPRVPQACCKSIGLSWRAKGLTCPEGAWPGSAYAAWNMPLDFHPGNVGQKYGVIAF